MIKLPEMKWRPLPGVAETVPLLNEGQLDVAEDVFDSQPTPKSACDLLEVALVYWSDDMIGDATFRDKVSKVRNWLAELRI